jgi:hypothetical protein
MFFILIVFTLYVLAISLTKGLYFTLPRLSKYNSGLEEYISAKKPQNVYELERLTRQYEALTVLGHGL